MISYIEKGQGLHAAIQSAGYSLVQIDGVWTSSNDEAVQSIIDGYSLAQTQAEVCRQVDEHGKNLRNALTAEYSPAEMASWFIKASEAVKYSQTGNAGDAPVLSMEAAARQIALSDLVAIVLGNSNALTVMEAQIAGTAGKHKDAIRALTTFDAVLTYNWREGWPL